MSLPRLNFFSISYQSRDQRFSPLGNGNFALNSPMNDCKNTDYNRYQYVSLSMQLSLWDKKESSLILNLHASLAVLPGHE